MGLEIIQIVGAIAPPLVMIIGLILVLRHLKLSGEPLNQNYIKMIGVILFVPMLPWMTILVADFPTDALITLLGTVAGYLLSRTGEDESKQRR